MQVNCWSISKGICWWECLCCHWGKCWKRCRKGNHQCNKRPCICKHSVHFTWTWISGRTTQLLSEKNRKTTWGLKKEHRVISVCIDCQRQSFVNNIFYVSWYWDMRHFIFSQNHLISKILTWLSTVLQPLTTTVLVEYMGCADGVSCCSKWRRTEDEIEWKLQIQGLKWPFW